ncbi:asparagine--tRNA ligase [Bacteriovorax stolpii]|uniref:asparagine--tRNA ligase n=1 Tax=Bacteriovorax stolpii TaxID=960 RepID=UPI00115A0311|nr:asparagine--tRNA ligase [Bacteriovorax stolpii]QDK41645.1 asparagine--tRNA ligase [Bacteriovorax stolpii]
MDRLSVKKILTEEIVDTDATVKGWLRSVRNSKKFSFLVLNDGSSQENLQIIVDEVLPNYAEVAGLLSGSAVAVTGRLVKGGGKVQSIEMQAKSVEIIGKTDETYPLQKKATSLEFLREQAHLRIRTNTFGAIMRVRHHLAMATHEFFSNRGFFYLNSPIISGVDAEGAGEMFTVSTLASDVTKSPKTKEGKLDFSRDYFGKETFLAVTGQLEGECYAMGLGAVYTFGPTFRSENSNTTRHLSEFWMIEPEVAFADLDEIAGLATDYIKYLISYALEKAPKELEFLINREDATCEKNHMEILKHVRDSKFMRITYTEAMEILGKVDPAVKKFEYPTNWGDELQTEHERYLAEVHFKMPVIVTDYPKQFKAFYMKLNPDGKTVRAMDILVPGVGEIIGGSQREDDLSKLEARMDEMHMQKEPLWWYLDLRRFGSVPHAGFGLGFERALMYITGMNNIRDVIPFPRTPKNCDF